MRKYIETKLRPNEIFKTFIFDISTNLSKVDIKMKIVDN